MASCNEVSKTFQGLLLTILVITSARFANGDLTTDTEANKTNETTLSSVLIVEEEFLGIIPTDTLRIIETVINGFILPVLVLCGVTGNVLNMAVFLKQGLKDRINVCLFCLAISDTGFDLTHLASRTFVLFNLFDEELGAAWQARAFFLTGVYLGFLLTSNTLTLLISLQRCIIVVNPLSAKTLPGPKQMGVVIAVLYVVCFFGVGFYSFRWTPGTCVDPHTNLTHDCIQLSQFSVDHQEMFNALTEITFMTVIPLLTLVGVTTSNVVIAVRMRSVLAWRKDTAHAGAANPQASSANTANQREAAMTKMLLVVCVVYCVCTIPAATQTVIRLLVPEFVASGRYNNAFYAALCISHLLESVNCSVNFIIYYTMSSRFSATFREMFHMKSKDQEKEKEEQEPRTRTSIVSTNDG